MTATGPATRRSEDMLPRLDQAPGFSAFIRTGWGESDSGPKVSAAAASAAAAHRTRVSDAFRGRAFAVAAGRAPVRVNDNLHEFRCDSDFAWLTNAPIEGAVLVFLPRGSAHDAVLFVPPPIGPADKGFYSDSLYGELWVGRQPTAEQWRATLGIEVKAIDDLDTALDPLTDLLLAGGAEPRLAGRPRSGELSTELAELRMIKDAWEIGQLRRAVDVTVEGFGAVAGEIDTARRRGGERWLQGTFDRFARTYGNGVGYSTIVGSGPHAPTLHWTRCDGPVEAGDALLLDMGVEGDYLYTADVTRTVPVSGSFTSVQRQVHDLVEASHRAGLAAVGPGRPWTAFHYASMEVIATGLADWGLLPVSVDEALSAGGQQHRRWLACGIGHHLGLDVHDCSALDRESYEGRTIEPGVVMTVEPGLYFHSNDLMVPPELRGLGVRIEDDVLVNDTGIEVLSSALPIDATGLEHWVGTAASS